MALVCRATLSDIAPTFNLIQEGSANGCFNSLYLQPRFQAGLAIQLFSVWMFGKIRVPSGFWYKATLHVIRHEGRYAGFLLMRHLEPMGYRQEIYMCAVVSKYRGHGLARRLIQSMLDTLENSFSVEAECLPRAERMKHLLDSIGFEAVIATEASHPENLVAKFRFPRGLPLPAANLKEP